MIRSNTNYEDEFKRVMGPNADNRVNLQQIYTLLQTIRVQMTIDERNHLSEWHRQHQDANGLVSALTLLADVGLPPQTLAVKDQRRRPTKELTQQELIEA